MRATNFARNHNNNNDLTKQSGTNWPETKSWTSPLQIRRRKRLRTAITATPISLRSSNRRRSRRGRRDHKKTVKKYSQIGAKAAAIRSRGARREPNPAHLGVVPATAAAEVRRGRRATAKGREAAGERSRKEGSKGSRPFRLCGHQGWGHIPVYCPWCGGQKWVWEKALHLTQTRPEQLWVDLIFSSIQLCSPQFRVSSHIPKVHKMELRNFGEGL
jgi:hypothetical protein